MLAVNAIAFVAEAGNHHPDLEVHWGRVVVMMQTHSAGGITEKDLQMAERIEDLMSALLDAAEAHIDWPLPGYTHLQRAQPVYLGHHLLAYVWMLERDRRRFRFVGTQVADLPLGAGALAGVNFDTDRRMVAAELGFTGVAPNSLDAVANRDFVLDWIGAAATCATHLSRLGAELVLWSSEEFGFVRLSDAWTSGSSIMPQKKNPDAAELLRAKAPRVVGHLSAMYGVLHALPLTYNKDMQEDKTHLFDAVDTLRLCLAASSGMVRGATFDRERMAGAASDDLIAATDIADLIRRRGTIYLLGREDPYASASPLMTALAEHVLDTALQLANESGFGRLCPPMLACLDELPSTAPLPTLATRMANERALGISFIWASQTWAQLTRIFGEQQARAIKDLTNSLIIFGGSKDASFNKEISDLLGTAAANSGKEYKARHILVETEDEAKAIGGACRYALRGIEDCYALNPKASKAAVFAGWKDMDGYMRENKIEGIPASAAEAPSAEEK